MGDMELNENIEKVKKMIVETKAIESFDETKHLKNDYGFDSLDFIMLIDEIEENFDVSIDSNNLGELMTFTGIKNYIYKNYGSV